MSENNNLDKYSGNTQVNKANTEANLGVETRAETPSVKNSILKANQHHLKVKNALLRISSLVLSRQPLSDIYQQIHQIIDEVIYVKNIAIFLYDPVKDIIVFDYFVDEKDQGAIGKTMPIGEGISSYVIKKNKPCLFTAAEQEALKAEGKISNVVGSLSESWMGAPIANDDGVKGIIILQSYSSAQMYTQDDLQLLSFVAANLAVVLQKRKLLDKERQDREALESSLDLIKTQNLALEAMMEQLKSAQDELVQKEKMASLGNLVAGVAHEINTPVGICVTAVSNLHHQYKRLQNKMANNTASNKDLSHFLEDVDESCVIIETNTHRAAELINSFKEIAIDQSCEVTREINIKSYIDEVLMALGPILKKSRHEVRVLCPEDVIFETIPGAISQILTNMINNSIIHAFSPDEKGCISIIVTVKNKHMVITYQDNGKGLNEEELKMLFEPFYTTKRGSGGSGLGAHLIYNIVTSSLNGKIKVQSKLGEGLRYDISIPICSD